MPRPKAQLQNVMPKTLTPRYSSILIIEHRISYKRETERSLRVRYFVVHRGYVHIRYGQQVLALVNILMGYIFLQTLKGGLGVSLQFTAIFSQNVGWVGGWRGCQDEWPLDCLLRFSTHECKGGLVGVG